VKPQGILLAAILPVLSAATACPAFARPEADADGAPDLQIQLRGDSLSVTGDVSSRAHAAILRQTALNRFGHDARHFSVRVRPALPAGWALLTEMTLSGMAELDSGAAEIDLQGVTIRGISADPGRWQTAAARIAASLPDGMALRQQVVEVGRKDSLQQQCLRLFRSAVNGRHIEFAPDRAELGTRQHPLLDELVEILADCPAADLVVTGHTDDTGDEAANLALSQARADAVAAYLADAGIARERLSAVGVGSSRPVVDESTSLARRLNRRIEFELNFPATPAPP